MKKRIWEILLVVFVIIGLSIGFYFLYSVSNSKKSTSSEINNDLIGYWRYFSYQSYVDDKLSERLENITGEYIEFSDKKVKKCNTKDNVTISCEEGKYNIKGDEIQIKSDSYSLPDKYIYEIKGDNLILTEINDNTKYINVYCEHEQK